MIGFKPSSLKRGDWNRLLKKHSDKRTADYIKKKKLPGLSLQPSNNNLKRVKQQQEQQQQQTKLTAISN